MRIWRSFLKQKNRQFLWGKFAYEMVVREKFVSKICWFDSESLLWICVRFRKKTFIKISKKIQLERYLNYKEGWILLFLKSKFSHFSANLYAISVIRSLQKKGYYSHNFIEKFVIMKEKFDFKLEAWRWVQSLKLLVFCSLVEFTSLLGTLSVVIVKI